MRDLKTPDLPLKLLTTDLERYIKMFLTMFHKVDQGSNGGSSKKKPMLITKMNFLTLLNLPECIRQFGPLRLLWEGGGMGTLCCISSILNNAILISAFDSSNTIL